MKNVRLEIPLYALAVAAVALWLFATWSDRQGRENATVIQMATQSLAAGKSHRAAQARLQAVAKAQTDSAAAWKRRALARNPVIARLDTALAAAATSRDSLVIVVQQNTELRAQVEDWRTAFGRLELARRADSTRADQAEMRIADLEANLRATLAVADCHILGVGFLPKCPSRTVAFVVGVGTGAAVVLATHH